MITKKISLGRGKLTLWKKKKKRYVEIDTT